MSSTASQTDGVELSDRSQNQESRIEHDNSDSFSPSLDRQLLPYHIFFIALGAVIGMGFYVRTGLVESIAGSGTVLCAYLFLGLLAMSVMQDLGRLLEVWPVSGALMAFVGAFLDKDLAVVIAILYWLTYCLSFAGLTTVFYGLVEETGLGPKPSKALSTCFSILIPAFFNILPIGSLRHFELFFGIVKLCLAVAFILVMFYINPFVNQEDVAVSMKREAVFQYTGPGQWMGGFCISVLYTAFSFVGIEAIAATATETRLDGTTHNPFHRPSKLVPQVTLLLYLIGGWIVTQNIAANDSRLPAIHSGARSSTAGASASLFIIAASDYNPVLAQCLRVMLIVSVASTSSTALYIASRTLFGLAKRFSGPFDTTSQVKRWWYTPCRILSKTNRKNVPWVAVLVSALCLCWIPIVSYQSQDPATFNAILDLVVEMGSVSCILVWGCISLAAARLYCCARSVRFMAPPRFADHIKAKDDAWFWLHVVLSSLTSFLCIAIVVVGGVMAYLFTSDIMQIVPIIAVLGILIIGTSAIKLIKLMWNIRSGKTPQLYSKLGDRRGIERKLLRLRTLQNIGVRATKRGENA